MGEVWRWNDASRREGCQLEDGILDVWIASLHEDDYLDDCLL